MNLFAILVILLNCNYLGFAFNSFSQKLLSSLLHNPSLLSNVGHFAGEVLKFLKDLHQTNEPLSKLTYYEFLTGYNNSLLCDTCINLIQEGASDTDSLKVLNALDEFGEVVCPIFENSTVCQGIIKSYSTIFLYSLTGRLFKPNQACNRMFLCPDGQILESLEEYAKLVLKDKPQINPPIPNKVRTYKFLHITDIHVDYNYSTGSNSQCNEPLCCREQNGPSPNLEDAAGYWGTLASCDIPSRTVDQFLHFISNNVKDIDFILWTGDNIAHNVWNQSESTQLYPTQLLTQAIKKFLPNVPIFAIFGNHECFPSDQCNITALNGSHWLTYKLSEIWKNWLTPEAYSDFRKRSFYSTYFEPHGIKIIALDTQTCDTLDFFIFRDPTDPLNQLVWLRQELYKAENNNESVFIIGHIPPGHSTCHSAWSARYQILIDRFSHIVRGQFFGHTHNDQIEISRSFKNNSPIGAAFIAPSLTTFVGLNPSFRVYEADQETSSILNYYQYRLDLNKWNKNITGPISWDIAYNFLSEYSIQEISFASLNNLVEKIKTDKKIAQKYVYNFFSGGKPLQNLSEQAIQQFYCQAKHAVFSDAVACMGNDSGLQNEAVLFFQSLPGPWYSPKPFTY